MSHTYTHLIGACHTHAHTSDWFMLPPARQAGAQAEVQANWQEKQAKRERQHAAIETQRVREQRLRAEQSQLVSCVAYYVGSHVGNEVQSVKQINFHYINHINNINHNSNITSKLVPVLGINSISTLEFTIVFFKVEKQRQEKMRTAAMNEQEVREAAHAKLMTKEHKVVRVAINT